MLPSLLNDFWGERNDDLRVRADGDGQDHDHVWLPRKLVEKRTLVELAAAGGTCDSRTHRSAGTAGRHSVLLLSAVEFYAFMAFDLADTAGKQMYRDEGHQDVGNTYTQCDSPAILKAFIERVYNRKVAAAQRARLSRPRPSPIRT